LKNMVWISQKSDFYIDRLSVLLQRKPKVAAPMAKLRWISKMGQACWSRLNIDFVGPLHPIPLVHRR
jgi:hypothetical protein